MRQSFSNVAKFNKLYDSYSKERKSIINLLFLYYDGSTINMKTLSDLRILRSASEIYNLTRELVSVGILTRPSAEFYSDVLLTPEGCLFSLIQYVRTGNYIPRNKHLAPTLKALFYYMKSDKIDAFSYDENQELTNALLLATFEFSEFDRLYFYLPIEIVDRFLKDTAISYTLNLYPLEGFQARYEKYVCHPQISATYKKQWSSLFVLICKFMKGELTVIPEPVTLVDFFIKAYCEHLKGNIQAAIAVYEEAIKQLAPDKVIPDNPLFAYSYALALIQDDTEKSKKKVAQLLKRQEIKKKAYYIPYLLFTLSNEIDKSKQIELAVLYKDTLPPLAEKLRQTIIAYYGILEYSNVETSDYKLIDLELSSAVSSSEEIYNSLVKDIGANSIIRLTKQVEEWEKLLDVINQQSFIRNKVMGEQPEEFRIAYLLNPDTMTLTPIRQKSRDGINWSKGRTVSLEQFYLKLTDGMNATDYLVSNCMQKFKSSYYHNYVSYEINTPSALLHLAGHSCVFSATNCNVPIEIVCGMPEMTLNRTKDGFAISLNVDTEDHPIKIVRENDTRIKVMRLSAEQLNMVKLLGSIKMLPIEAEQKLTQLLKALNNIITIHSDLIDTSDNLKIAKADDRIIVQLIPINDMLKVELFIKPLTVTPPYCKPGIGAKSIIGIKDNEQVQLIRNFDKEKEHYEIIATLIQEISGDDEMKDTVLFEDPYSCLELLDALCKQSDIAIIEWPEGVDYRISRQADIDNLSLSLKKGKGNWFQVEGVLNIDNNVLMTIQDLILSIKKSKGRFIAIGENEYLALTKRLRERLKELDATVEYKGRDLKIPEYSIINIDNWVEEGGGEIKGDKPFQELKKRIVQAEKKIISVPKQLYAELRDYQLEGFRWIVRLAEWGMGACLADDMGLGKTVQSIALLLHKAEKGPSLIITPSSVLLNWRTEINKFAPAINILVLNSTNNRATMIEQATAYDVVLTTYGLLVSEKKQLIEKDWNVIILDEAHTIKNHNTKTSKSAMRLNAGFRVILTGTPIQNHLGEIWNLFQFINPGLLGSLEHFIKEFIHPIQNGDKTMQKYLKKLISPFMLRRTKIEVLGELPPKTEIIKEIELSEAEMAFYEVIRRDTESKLANGTITIWQTLSEITRLRQAACNTQLVNKNVKLQSAKEEVFLDIVDELLTGNHRALVFSQFTSHLALIQQALNKRGIEYLYLDGSIQTSERERLVKRFQAGTQPLFLISLKAGGVGLNLTAADYVIHLDPWWNPAIEDQASDRAYRIGQQHPVTVYKLIAKHTIEEKIIQLHTTKKDMANSLLEGSNMAHKLTREELLELLK